MHAHLDDPDIWEEVEPGRWQMPVEVYDDGGEQWLEEQVRLSHDLDPSWPSAATVAISGQALRGWSVDWCNLHQH